MALLFLGVIVWYFVHLLPSLSPSVRQTLISKIGEGPYKGLFATTLLGSVGLMVLGWQSTDFVLLYQLPAWSHHLCKLMIVIGFLLMGATRGKGFINRIVRHPQLTGFTLWATAHLLPNGDLRSVILFAGLALWSITAMLLVNRRDGEWQKPEYGGFHFDVIAVVVGLAMTALFVFCHVYITGIALI